MGSFLLVVGHQMSSQMNFNQPNYGQNLRQGQGQSQIQAPRYPNDQQGGNNRGPQSYQQQQSHQTSDYNSNNQSALNGMLLILP